MIFFSDVEGTFTWTTDQDKLEAGDNTLGWKFTQDDTDHYAVITGTVVIPAEERVTTTTTTTEETTTTTAEMTTSTTEKAITTTEEATTTTEEMTTTEETMTTTEATTTTTTEETTTTTTIAETTTITESTTTTEKYDCHRSDNNRKAYYNGYHSFNCRCHNDRSYKVHNQFHNSYCANNKRDNNGGNVG